ncbi:MAG: FAD-dependent oxidoreductase [Methylococcales bacterium]|jgi:flavin-dependent dehydrogenase|nr:FAD-dependent oxidoreductase [Methylococcales bacterium]
MSTLQNADVCILGAGPSGAIAAALLVQKGYRVTVLEKMQFPRFSIGESLLPQCMAFIKMAGMEEAVLDAGFQFKNGAAFAFGEKRASFDFSEKVSEGPATTFQVQRDKFDKILADEAAKMGADIYYQHEVVSVDMGKDQSRITYKDKAGIQGELTASFVLDASGFGRVLPRLLALESPSDFPVRQSLFTHIQDNILDTNFDREKILITIHPEHRDVWFWLIPFSDGRCSLGVVAEPKYFTEGVEHETQLKKWVEGSGWMGELLSQATFDRPVQKITGYSSNVSALHGDGFALLGNAGEFLDPVFSSGVTIAMKSAVLASEVLDQQLQGRAVDWQKAYAEPLMQGVDTFRTFVQAWYDERLQNIVLYPEPNQKIKNMVCAILAGYAWDEGNPYVVDSERRINTLAELCSM